MAGSIESAKELRLGTISRECDWVVPVLLLGALHTPGSELLLTAGTVILEKLQQTLLQAGSGALRNAGK